MNFMAYYPRGIFSAVAIIAFIAVPRLQAQHAGAGTTIFPSLTINYDARTVALAGASAALPGDLCCVLSNPAAIGFISRQQVYVGYRPLLGGLNGAPLAYARPEKELGVFAVTFTGLTSGTFEAIDVGSGYTPVATGEFARADYIAGNISWGTMLNPFFAAGITVKGIYNYIGTPGEHFSADGIAIDGGVQFRSADSRVIYGFAMRNFGILRSGYTKEDDYKLPAVVELGVSYIPRDIEGFRIVFDMNKKRDDYVAFEPAFEWDIIKRQLVLRAGYGFSWSDMEAAVKVLEGEPDEDHVKTNRTTLCLGAGIITALMERPCTFDAAFEFNDGGIAMPALVVSMLIGL